MRRRPVAPEFHSVRRVSEYLTGSAGFSLRFLHPPSLALAPEVREVEPEWKPAPALALVSQPFTFSRGHVCSYWPQGGVPALPSLALAARQADARSLMKQTPEVLPPWAVRLRQASALAPPSGSPPLTALQSRPQTQSHLILKGTPEGGRQDGQLHLHFTKSKTVRSQCTGPAGGSDQLLQAKIQGQVQCCSSIPQSPVGHSWDSPSST